MNFEKLIIDSKEKDIATLKEEISQIMLDKIYSTDIFTTFTFNGFFRARNHNHLEGELGKKGILHRFTNETEFWNPPIQCVESGRCNEKWESLFYCASDFNTSVLEVKPEEGDYITISNFENLHNFNKPMFRIKPIGIRYLTKIPALNKLFEDYKLNHSQIEMDDFLDELFHQQVSEKELYKYKLSTAISKIFFTDTTNYKREIFQTEGLIYSSVIRDKKSYCFVLKPWFVHTYFFINYIQTWQILEKTTACITMKLVRHGQPNQQKIYPADLFDIYWEDASTKSDIKVLYY